MTDVNKMLRSLPQVDHLVQVMEGDAGLPHGLLVRLARETIDRLREGIRNGEVPGVPTEDELAGSIRRAAVEAQGARQIRVINATGVVLHTNLGRAVLPAPVLEEAVGNLRGYSLLEMNRESGKRSKRDFLVSDLLVEMTGAEDATVVNNNAAATHLILHTLADGKEVICSHAHLVGIGGSFRLPDCMRQAGVELKTVGATNHCQVADYENGIGERTGMLLSVHTSNYQIVGFTKFATLEELVELGRRKNVPVVYDLGSGAMADVTKWGFRGHNVAEIVSLGPDLICFSGDKLLGGPQAGIIVGRKDAVAAIRKNPYYRMMRPDKMTLLLLEATLRLYRDPEKAAETVPVLKMISRTREDLRPVAEMLAGRLREGTSAGIDVFEDISEVGGGSLSNQGMPTVCVGIRPEKTDVDSLAKRLRLGDPSIIVCIRDGRVVIDMRTLLDGEAVEIVDPLRAALS